MKTIISFHQWIFSSQFNCTSALNVADKHCFWVVTHTHTHVEHLNMHDVEQNDELIFMTKLTVNQKWNDGWLFVIEYPMKNEYSVLLGFFFFVLPMCAHNDLVLEL